MAGKVFISRDGPPAAKKNTLKPWLKKQWCIPKVGGEFVAAMEDVGREELTAGDEGV